MNASFTSGLSVGSARVALYGRFSDERQNPMSARDQLALCDERAAREGWRVVERLTDEAVSGSVRMRPGYQALRRTIADGKIDMIVAEALDRISRDQEETANLYKLCLFHEVEIFTLSEGRINELHVGLSSTINAVYLRQLAEKTHRGLNSRVTAGKSAGGKAYGYRVLLLPNGLPSTGDLEIVENEAVIVRRIMMDYASGLSPKKIAATLNMENTPSPGGGKWKANTLHGNRQRGTGILNNELYVGRRVWNRQRFVHKPGERNRVSRLNPREQWRVEEIHGLRIVPDDLWQKVKERQRRLDVLRSDSDTGDDRHCSGAHAAKRPTYLLSGLIYCANCGGRMNIGGSKPKRYYCANAREKGSAVCQGIGGIGKDRLESLILDGIRDHLMQPEAVAAFIEAYLKYQKTLRAEQTGARAQLEKALRNVERDIQNVLNAIKAGVFTTSTKAELETLEHQKERLESELRSRPDTAPVLRSDLAVIYRTKVKRLVEALSADDTRTQAGEAIRQLVDKVVVGEEASSGTRQIELVGELAALLSLGTNENAAAFEAAASSLKLVAGAGFEPATFRL